MDVSKELAEVRLQMHQVRMAWDKATARGDKDEERRTVLWLMDLQLEQFRLEIGAGTEPTAREGDD